MALFRRGTGAMSKQEQIEAADHDGPSQSQKAFQAQVDMLAHHWIGVFMASGVPPVMASLAASQVIQAGLLDLARNNRPDVAKALLGNLCQGLVEFWTELGENPELNAEGQTKQ